MNLKFLETFIWVTRLHSFSLAAEKMHSTQAAVSSRISALEEELGVKLLFRDPKGVTLTRDGEVILHHAQQICEGMTQLRSSLIASKLATGSIRIGAMDSAIHAWCMDFVIAATQIYPHLDVEVSMDTALNLNDQLQRGSLDMTIQTDLVRHETIRSVELFRLPLAWVASPQLALIERDDGNPTVAMRSIARHRIITYSRNSKPHQDIENLFHAHGIGEVRIVCVNSVTAMVKLAQSAFGIAAMPPAIVPNELLDGSLQTIDVAPPPAMPFVIAWRTKLEWADRLVELAMERARIYIEAVDATEAGSAIDPVQRSPDHDSGFSTRSADRSAVR